jgi:hypothetical protein
MASAGAQWLATTKRTWLADDDPALPPEQLRSRLKQRRKLARRAERATALALGLPPPDPHTDKGGRPALQEVKQSTLQRRGRRAANRVVLASIDFALPDFQVSGLQVAAAVDAVGETVAAAEHSAADFAANERAASDWAASEAAAAEQAIQQAAAGVAAAEIEAAIDQAAASAAMQAECVAIGEAVEGMVAALETAEAPRLRLEKRLAREVASDRGYIDEARTRLSARNENPCFICMDSHTDAYMPCCQHRVHSACIKRWHAMGQDKDGRHAVKAPRRDGGWKPVAMARVHECPHCGAEMLSACVPRV